MEHLRNSSSQAMVFNSSLRTPTQMLKLSNLAMVHKEDTSRLSLDILFKALPAQFSRVCRASPSNSHRWALVEDSHNSLSKHSNRLYNCD